MCNCNNVCKGVSLMSNGMGLFVSMCLCDCVTALQEVAENKDVRDRINIYRKYPRKHQHISDKKTNKHKQDDDDDDDGFPQIDISEMLDDFSNVHVNPKIVKHTTGSAVNTPYKHDTKLNQSSNLSPSMSKPQPMVLDSNDKKNASNAPASNVNSTGLQKSVRLIRRKTDHRKLNKSAHDSMVVDQKDNTPSPPLSRKRKRKQRKRRRR